MILKSNIVVTMDGPPIPKGAVAIDDNVIVAVGPAAELEGAEEVIDLGDQALMPGLINAHCHLDYSTLRYSISPQRSFTDWVRRINAVKRALGTEDYLYALRRGFEELQKWGTTSVGNIESIPEVVVAFGEPPIRTWWFYEMIDIRHRFTSEEVVLGALSFFQELPRSLSHFGLSPHAPYTASSWLYSLANQCAETQSMLLTTHVAESMEEREMFQCARGPLYDFMKALGRPMHDCGHETPFERLWRSGSITADWLLVHMNELEESDFRLLAALGPEGTPHVVHCPGSHAYFRHRQFQYQRLHELGVNICIGTDSLASTHSLSLLGELRRLRGTEPWMTPEQLLETVTTRPARALQQTGRLGVLRVGACADLIAVPVTGNPERVHEEIVEYRQPIPWMMIDGQIRS